MKKFKFTIQGNDYEVEVLNYEDDIAEIDINGAVYKVQVHREIKTTKTPKLIRTKVEPSSNADVPKTRKPGERKGVGVIKAPLPGTILSVSVKQGDKVKV
ncbi:MAG: acetyl-CoA carboxylase biotin carboxyl carrier protein subunit, partial [Ignavibacteriales bacterium]